MSDYHEVIRVLVKKGDDEVANRLIEIIDDLIDEYGGDHVRYKYPDE